MSGVRIKRGGVLVRIKRGGVLVRVEWDSDEAAYYEKPVEFAATRLFDSCDMEEGVTLGDILQLLREPVEVYEMLLGDLTGQIVAEGLSGKSAPTTLRFLQLYWNLEHDVAENTLTGFLLPDFVGFGPNADEDDKDTTWAIGLRPIYELVDLPVILVPEVQVRILYPPEEIIYKGAEFTLGHILRGIIYELSYYGPADARDDLAERLANGRPDVGDTERQE